MSVTAADVLLLLKGKASKELQSQFLAEAAQPDSEVLRMLQAVESWAQTKLNPNCPSPQVPVPAVQEKPVVRVVKKAAFWDEKSDPESEPPVTIQELLEHIRGMASPETAARVKQAMADPSSELFRLFKQLQQENK